MMKIITIQNMSSCDAFVNITNSIYFQILFVDLFFYSRLEKSHVNVTAK